MDKRKNNHNEDSEQEEFDYDRVNTRNRRLNNKWRDKKRFNQDDLDEEDYNYEDE